VPKAMQKNALIIYRSISYRCVGVRTKKMWLVLDSFFRAVNNITGGSNRGGGW